MAKYKLVSESILRKNVLRLSILIETSAARLIYSIKKGAASSCPFTCLTTRIKPFNDPIKFQIYFASR